MNGKKPMRNKSVASEKVEQILIYNPRTKKHHILNETAGKIWELSDGRHTVEEITEVLCREFDAPVNEAKKDVLHTLETLSEAGAIIMK
ncbi:MAG: PqqD family protein [Theionarchaea archaeon]|nr:MAG: hypothetical protein AYK19_01450 [Theionarchaea archaeon DG-70-1]MBU7029393.1 PqqD family protein [Theionarchaea archaeon]